MALVYVVDLQVYKAYIPWCLVIPAAEVYNSPDSSLLGKKSGVHPCGMPGEPQHNLLVG